MPKNGDKNGERQVHRAIFISDVHLGMRNCQAQALLDFLRFNEAEAYYLVGDIVDFWKFGRGLHWPQQHNDVLQKLLRKARKGARLVFIPGNHDHGLRKYIGLHFGGLEIRRNTIHTTARGERFLVLHGDEFDSVMRTAPVLAFLGDKAYDAALWLNNPLNRIREWIGRDYWSLAAYLKGRVKSAVSFISRFEQLVAEEARRKGADGVVCGHIHQAADRRFNNIRYINCGDWVESCTAAVETMSGEMKVIHWRAGVACEHAPQEAPAESIPVAA